MRAMRYEKFSLRVKCPRNKVAEPPDIRAIDKSRLCVKAGCNVLVHGVEFQTARAALRVNHVGRAGLMCAIAELGFTGYSLGLELPVLVDLDLRINAAHAVEPNVTAQCCTKRIR